MNMKPYIIILCIVIMSIATGCPDAFDDLPNYLEVSNIYIEFDYAGGSDTVWLKEKDAIWWMLNVNMFGTWPADSIDRIIYDKDPKAYKKIKNNANELIVTDSLNFSRSWFSLTIPPENQNNVIIKCSVNEDTTARQLDLYLTTGKQDCEPVTIRQMGKK